jgi:hypothetical protein
MLRDLIEDGIMFAANDGVLKTEDGGMIQSNTSRCYVKWIGIPSVL